MNLDIRLPMGIMFTIFGAILTAYGVITKSNETLYRVSLGFNINLLWGLVLLAFGVLLVVFARRAMSQGKTPGA
jgi:hypothetical protein